MDEHREGLHHDLPHLIGRRSALQLMGAAGAGLLLTSPAALAKKATTVVPSETAGPYPGDGSNGPNVLDDSGVVRRDIRKSFGSASGRATGVPLRVNLTVTDASNDFKAISGAAVYAWHCDRIGRYSLYSSGVTNQNWLRGVQRTNSAGTATFTTIYPGCYPGRWPHIHFEVYESVADAVKSGPIVKTSQIALPAAISKRVYASSRYSGSQSNLRQLSLKTDGVFGNDGGVHQLATCTGSVAKGYVANLTIGVWAASVDSAR